MIVFHGIIDNLLNNKKLNTTVTKLLFRGGKLNISLVFITQSENS